jgi:hypothetical protein
VKDPGRYGDQDPSRSCLPVLVAWAALGQLGIEVGQHGPQPGDPLGQMSVRGAIAAVRGEIIDGTGEPAE